MLIAQDKSGEVLCHIIVLSAITSWTVGGVGVLRAVRSVAATFIAAGTAVIAMKGLTTYAMSLRLTEY